jgi:hypothetical protein
MLGEYEYGVLTNIKTCPFQRIIRRLRLASGRGWRKFSPMPALKLHAVLLILLLGITPASFAQTAPKSGAVNFAEDIAPILLNKCQVCHGPDKSKGNYRLHTLEMLLKPGSSKEAPITPGSPEKSHLYQLLTAKSPDDRMPQDDDPLPAAQIALIERWIRGGAKLDGLDPKNTLAALAARRQQPDPPAVYPRPVPITALGFNPEGSELAAGGYHEITVWNPADGKLLRRIKNVAQNSHALVYSPDGQIIAVAGGTPGRLGEVKLFNAADGKLRSILGTFPDMALCVAISPDGQRVASGGTDNSIRIYDTASGRQELLVEQHADWVLGVAWSPDGTHLASASRDKSARVFDAKTGALEYSYLGHGDAVFAVAFTGVEQQVCSSGRDKKIHVWEISSAVTLGNKKASRKPEITGFNGDVLKVVVQDGSIFSCSADKQFHQHDLGKRELTRTFSGHGDFVYSLAVHAKSGRVASGDYVGEVRVWNTADGKLLLNFRAAPGFQTAQK